MSETIAATATLSCTFMQLGMVLGVGLDGICDLDLCKKRLNTLTYFSVFRFQYGDNLT